jgi:phosphoribosylanthranilate isomerase
VLVKICGITNREDAMAAVDMGAGALGFVFYARSPRAASVDAVREWIGEVPAHVLRVGVYVNEAPTVIEANAKALGLHVAQLHGDETPAEHPVSGLIWRAFRIAGDAVPQPEYPADALLLDGPGSGRTFDWKLAAGLPRRVVLAGGLTPENVREAIETAKPWAVDTASGVEAVPGRKDHARMKKFIETALNS